MIALALTGLEKAINAYLSLDKDTLIRLTKLKDKIIKIDITDWNINFFVIPRTHGIEIKKTHQEKADTTIAGTLFGLFHVGCAKGKNEALFKNAVDISGDTGLGEAMRDILSQVDIDWEEHLSNVIGDVAAHQMGVGLRRACDIVRHATATLSTNIKEYLQQEAKHVPSPAQVEKYICDVHTLQNDVDRAEARIERLIATRETQA